SRWRLCGSTVGWPPTRGSASSSPTSCKCRSSARKILKQRHLALPTLPGWQRACGTTFRQSSGPGSGVTASNRRCPRSAARGSSASGEARWSGPCPRVRIDLDAPRGFEPRLTESESVVLPLDDGAAGCGEIERVPYPVNAAASEHLPYRINL